MTSLVLPEGPIVPVGPPASGKSTLARQLVEQGMSTRSIVSLDDIRTELCPTRPCECPTRRPDVECAGGFFCMCNFPEALELLHARAHQRAREGLRLFFDATHLRARSWRLPLEIAARCGQGANALLFTELPLEELERRNASRPNRVPAPALEAMHAQRKNLAPDVLLAAGFATVHTIDNETEFVL